MSVIIRGSNTPPWNPPPWFDEAAYIYLAIGLCLVGVIRTRPAYGRRIGLIASTEAIKSFLVFAFLGIAFWPLLWLFDRLITYDPK